MYVTLPWALPLIAIMTYYPARCMDRAISGERLITSTDAKGIVLGGSDRTYRRRRGVAHIQCLDLEPMEDFTRLAEIVRLGCYALCIALGPPVCRGGATGLRDRGEGEAT